MVNKRLRSTKLWKIVLPLLILANAGYLSKNFFGVAVTLGFFLTVPGYMLLTTLKHEIRSRWEIAGFSLGLSLFLLVVSGLALNSLHAFGLSQPLTTLNIFIMFDFVSIALMSILRKKSISLPAKYHRSSLEELLFGVALTALPLLAIGGAIRLNNSASNILTMVLFASVAVLFVLLIWREKLSRLYPYALFTMGLAVLLSTSLRGWFITGHDIQHEYLVFQATSKAGFWTMIGHRGDDYNACLSITILPTIIAKITAIPAQYVYKAVFQTIFAFGLLPIYFLAKRLSNKRAALMAAFVFIAFPTFLDDMAFLNRQEIAFVFFALLMSVNFMKMARKPKVALSFMLLGGLILSHYSSGYVALILLLFAWVFSKLLGYKRDKKITNLPVLKLSIIFVALLFTFLWNMQVTASAGNLTGTVSQTAKDLVDGTSAKEGFIQYGLIPSQTQSQSPAQALADYAGNKNSQARFAPPTEIPITRLGKSLSKFVDVESLNNSVHALDAKLFQVLLLIGLPLILLRWRRKVSSEQLYFSALVAACVTMLILWTILPQISIGYTIIRLFQQTLVITALPIVLASEFIFSFLRRYKTYCTAILLALLFLDLSGFIPQSIGGYLPQLSLNNAGQYYDYFYNHKSDIVSADWLAANRDSHTPVFMDATTSSDLSIPIWAQNDVMQNGRSGYLYLEYIDVNKHIYRDFIDGLNEYSDPSLTANRNTIYANDDDIIYGAGS